MPLVKISNVISFSSEDPNYPAENMLGCKGYCKWLCKAGSQDKQSWIVLKLEKLVKITGIDIGNENCAFIEVLVGREGIEFEVILVASSFMTPIESRNLTNCNRVRIFDLDKLNKKIIDQKWDRVKIVCTQPFSKNIQYGITFIKFHSTEEFMKDSTEKLGQFVLEDEDSKSDSITVGSFFAKRKEKDSLRNITEDNLSKIYSKQDETPQLKHLNEDDLLKNEIKIKDHTKSGENGKEKFEKDCRNDHKAQTSKSTSTLEKEHISKPSKPCKSFEKSEKKNFEGSANHPKHKVKAANQSSKCFKQLTKEKKSKPFNKLMEEVVFVMSGYKNPQRSELRDKMLEMGAKYKGDWDSRCTHLVCAFANTPKFQAVKGKGRIVSEKWICDSHSKMIRQPWKKYNLEKISNFNESDEEVYATEILATDRTSAVISEKDEGNEPSNESEDTDEEIERLMKENKNAKRKNLDLPQQSPNKITKSNNNENLITTKIETNNSQSKDNDDYDADTDVDEEINKRVDTSDMPLPKLNCYFSKKNFFLYGSMEENDHTILRRYIIAHDGNVLDYMRDNINYVITEDRWDENFDDALISNGNLQFIKPEWIWKCCDKQKFVPPQPYLIVPNV